MKKAWNTGRCGVSFLVSNSLLRSAWRSGTVNLRQKADSSFASLVSAVSTRRSPQMV
ncbi:hypothetical protein D3C78_1605350 [compost metagenome]